MGLGFNEWLDEGESWGVRRERMLEDIQVDPDNMNSLFKWLEAAYKHGYDIGYMTGNDIGYDAGFDCGYDKGHDDGHHEGLMKG